MRAYFGRRYHLSASHRLRRSGLSEEENRALYGKCSNPYGHGHNYTIEVVAGGQVDPVTGMVCDMVELDRCVKEQVLERFDFANLNCDPAFAERVPTTENFNVEVYNLLRAAFTQAEIVSVRVEETAKNSFEYPAPRQTERAGSV